MEKASLNEHGHSDNRNDEWYTPAHIIEAARRTMGGIDTDPASNEHAQLTVKASTYYTITNSGLDKPWPGRVWLNPPYSGKLGLSFIQRLRQQLDAGITCQAVAIQNEGMSTERIHLMLQTADAIFFPDTRIAFVDKQGREKPDNSKSQMISYHGNNSDRFYAEFSPLGEVLIPYHNHKKKTGRPGPTPAALEPAAELLRQGKSVLAVSKATGITRYTLAKLKKSIEQPNKWEPKSQAE